MAGVLAPGTPNEESQRGCASIWPHGLMQRLPEWTEGQTGGRPRRCGAVHPSARACSLPRSQRTLEVRLRNWINNESQSAATQTLTHSPVFWSA